MKCRLQSLHLVYRLLLVFFLVVTAGWPLIPAPVRAAPPDPPPTPTLPATSTRDSSEPASDVSAEDAPTPTPGDPPPEIDESLARQAVEATLAKYADHYGLLLPLDVSSFQVEGEWAYAVAAAEGETGDLEAAGVPADLHLLARRLPDGTWHALLPGGDDLYRQWVEDVPESLVPAGEKARLQAQAVEAETLWQTLPASEIPSLTPSKAPGEMDAGAIVTLAGPTVVPTPVPLKPTDTAMHPITKSTRPPQQSVSSPHTPSSGSGPHRIYLPSVRSIGAAMAPEQPTMVPGTVEVEPEVEDAIRQALRRAYTILPSSDYYSVSDLERRDDWIFASVVGLKNLDPDLHWNLLVNANWFGLVLLRQSEKGHWGAAVQGTPEFSSLLDEIPATILSPTAKQDMDPLRRGVAPTDLVLRFPWQSGTKMQYGPLGVHNAGFFSGWKAVDFLSDGNTGAGNAPNRLLAATSGSISYVCRDGTSVAIRIGDLLYAHLLDNGSLNIGHYFGQGAEMGQLRPGSFSGNCGWADQGSNWFHVHWGFPNSDTFQVEDWTLNVWDGLWRRGGETRGIWSWFQAEGSGSACSAPSLIEPANGAVLSSRTITFRWNAVSGCTFNGYTFRVCTSSDVDNLGNCFIDTGEGGTQRTETIDGRDNQDLCWGVKAANAPNGANWAVRRFRIEPGSPSPDHSVQFYKDWHYQTGYCYGDNEGNYNNLDGCAGYNDQISSVLLKSGWSVRVFKDADLGQPSRCFTSSDDDFANDTFDDGSGLNDELSSFALYYQSSCPPLVTPPSAPSLQSPGNGAVFDEGQEIVLSWSATGDEYYGEVWGGPAGTTHFGWQIGTSKNIGSQWAGYTYSWHVKARNSAGESGWSSTRSFTVRPAAPSNLSAQVASCSQVNLNWSDNSGNEEGYKIYRNGAYVGQVGANGTSYQDAGLSESTSYSYYIKAFRGSIESDSSNTVNVSTPSCVPPQPDLMPAQWGGWQYPIVPSSITGTTVVDTLHAGDLTYVDWGITNSGDADAGGDSYGDLYLDDIRLAHFNFGDVLVGWSWAFFDWPSIVVNAPGWHTLRVVADPDDLIAESDETNNIWEHQFYWISSAPYADDMENGPAEWTATGLWHLGDENANLYAESHSWSHSWWYGQDAGGHYDTGSANSGSLTSRSIYIPTPGYYLRFWYRYETETQGLDWDQRWVQVSVDDGPFENVLQLGDDPMNMWLQSPAIQLHGYAGHSIQVRFHFDTVNGLNNAYRGWYVDDFEISSTPPPTCADSYEPNNSADQATAVTYGQILTADICPNGDYDFYQFTGSEGDGIVVDIDARVNGSVLDPYVFLLDSDEATVLAANDDDGTSLDSKLGYRLPHDGTYYVKVRAWNHPSAGGSDYFYAIQLTNDTTNPSSAEITAPGDGSWLDHNLQTITVSATDDESGIRNVGFLWHDADWEDSEWIWLGDDWDSSDGWSFDFDTSGLADQWGGAFYVWAFDWVGNWTGAGAWNLGVDRTPPTVSADVTPMYGGADFLDFWVGWNGSDNLSGIASYDVQYREGSAGGWIDLLTHTALTYFRFVGEDGHTYDFRARARDFAGNQSAYAEGDGDVQHTVDVSPISPDAYEPDNSCNEAKAIATNGSRQSHSFHTIGDQDWLQFTAVAGITFTLVTTNTGGYADTVLYLYESNCTTLVGFNDDDPDNFPASRLEWQPTADGVFYVMVEHWDEYAYGASTEYGISILADEVAPVAVDDNATTDENTAVAISVLNNDSDFNGDSLSVSAVGPPNHGIATISGTQSVMYTPTLNFHGSDTFTYTVSDGSLTDNGTVTVAVNGAPTAVDDAATTDEDMPVVVSVLSNDDDPENDSLRVAAVGPGAHGATTISGTYTVVYSPTLDFHGSDTFTYTVSDGSLTDSGTVTVTVNGAPVAVDDTASTDEDTPVVVDVLSNDSDPEDDGLFVSTVGPPVHGTAIISGPDTVIYTPGLNFYGNDTFAYTVSDGRVIGGASVTVTVTAVKEPPAAVDDSVRTGGGIAVTVDVLSNDSDPDGDSLFVSAIGSPTYGATAISGTQAVVYTPTLGFNGSDTFAYTVSDGEFADSATVTVKVNDAPVAVDDSASTDENTPVAVSVLLNDSDPNDNSLFVRAVGPPAHGTATLSGTQTVIYTPQMDFGGSDTFTYTVSDGDLTDGATVTLMVRDAAPAPPEEHRMYLPVIQR